MMFCISDSNAVHKWTKQGMLMLMQEQEYVHVYALLLGKDIASAKHAYLCSCGKMEDCWRQLEGCDMRAEDGDR
jgi:hypothetical protein